MQVEKPVTKENLDKNLAMIPLDIIQSLVNNLMKPSFNESVPSKYLTIMNDARDPMFSDYTAESYKSLFDKCLLANNGVVYIMNRTISPADYASVIAPALTSQNTQIMKTVIRADDKYINGKDYNNAPLQQYFSTYLKAMKSHFSFFVPTDDAFGYDSEGNMNTNGLVDPVVYNTIGTTGDRARYWRFKYNSGSSTNISGRRIAVDATAYSYNAETGPTSGDKTVSGYTSPATGTNSDLSSGKGAAKKYLLMDLVNQHIVVHENADPIFTGNQKYYLSRGGAPIFIKSKGNSDGTNMQVEGGFQVA